MVDLPVFRFWLNDDADTGDISEGDSDVPGRSGGLLGNELHAPTNSIGHANLFESEVGKTSRL
ncbi:MAG: hypothetical protein M5U15_08460 [Kiritimatiellae bacterium]|nr:hypothetical protein [Kiritimatiellia bacterium]